MKAKRHKTMPLVEAFYYSVSIIRILTKPFTETSSDGLQDQTFDSNAFGQHRCN